MLEVPPPGAGFSTVTNAVPAVAMSAALIAACTLLLEIKVVARRDPSHCTTAPATNPLPFTVKENPGPPGAVLTGTNDGYTSGCGFDCASEIVPMKIKNNAARRRRFIVSPDGKADFSCETKRPRLDRKANPDSIREGMRFSRRSRRKVKMQELAEPERRSAN